MALTIYESKTGKRYFIVNGRRVYINSKMTRKEAIGIYNILKKNIPKRPTNINKAKAVVHIHGVQTKRTKRTRRKAKSKSKEGKSTGNAPVVTVSKGNPNNALQEDKINSLTNQINKANDEANCINNNSNCDMDLDFELNYNDFMNDNKSRASKVSIL